MAGSALVRSETGSGKTLAFLLPVVNALVTRIADDDRADPRDGGEDDRRTGMRPRTAVQERDAAFVRAGKSSAVTPPQLEAWPHRVGGAGGAAAMDSADSDEEHMDEEHDGRDDHGRGTGTLALVLAPTRELCQQIYAVAVRLCQASYQIVPGIVAGGEKRKSEKARLRKGVTILVATPGRLLDHLKTTSSFRVDHLSWLILDEADRLLDMGFGPQVAEVVQLLRQRSAAGGGAWQVWLISATLNRGVRTLAKDVMLQAAAHVHGGEINMPLLDASLSAAEVHEDESSESDGEEAAVTHELSATEKRVKDEVHRSKEVYETPVTLTQSYAIVPLKWRLVTILAAVHDTVRQLRRVQRASTSAASKILLFLSTTASVDFHFALLSTLLPTMLGSDKAVPSDAVPIFRLHGDLPQHERTATYRGFCDARRGVLLATDVASRGLDLPAVDAIIQADAPSDTLDYVHRIGRTARKGERGMALLLLQPHEHAYVDILAASGMSISATDTAPILNSLARATLPRALLHEVRDAAGDGVIDASLAIRAGLKGPKSSVADSADAGGVVSGRRLPARIERLLTAAQERDTRARASAPTSEEATHAAELWAALWQGVCEEVVDRLTMPAQRGDASTRAMSVSDAARAAFTSFVRAYATHDRAVRHIFHPKALHLGHAAKAFGLREVPTQAAAKDRRRAARDAPTDAGAARGPTFGSTAPNGPVHTASKRTAAPVAALSGKRRREVSEFDA